MPQLLYFITVPSLCSSLLKVIDNLAMVIDGVSTLPPNLKARILHLMQKRGLVSDENIDKVCGLETTLTFTWKTDMNNDILNFYLFTSMPCAVIQFDA